MSELEKSEINVQPVGIRFGIIAAFVSVLSSVILFILNIEFNSISKWIPTIAMISIILVAQKQIVNTNAPHLFSLGKLFKVGFIITLIASIAMLVYFFLYSNYIAPDFMDKVLEISRAEMMEKGLSEEQIETGIEMTKKFMSPASMMVISFIVSVILGSLTSLIGAAIFRNEK